MKNLKLIFAVLIVFSLYSCKKEQIFSCDPKINAFVEDNAQLLSESNLTELSKYDLESFRIINNFL